MTTFEVLSSKEMQIIHDMYMDLQERKQQVAYNLFSLSSYNNQKENFHSDVIASLLDPQGKHREGDKFLMAFIDFLNAEYNLQLQPSEFSNSSVVKEQGRIDIWIRDRESKACILIENKMNNADDRVGQITDYYNYAIRDGYTVKAVVYLTPDDTKPIPPLPTEIEHVSRKTPAFTGNRVDMVNGWLEKCYSISQNPEGFTLIYQYITLIKQLNYNALYNEVKFRFYQLVSPVDTFYLVREFGNLQKDLLANESIQKVHKTAMLFSSAIYQYRRDLFLRQWDGKDTHPFQKAFAWHGWDTYGVIFEYFRFGLYKFKLDVLYLTEGNVNVRLWIPDNDGAEGNEACKSLLDSVGLSKGFMQERNPPDSKISRVFTTKEYGSLIAVDEAVMQFVKLLLANLRILEKK